MNRCGMNRKRTYRYFTQDYGFKNSVLRLYGKGQVCRAFYNFVFIDVRTLSFTRGRALVQALLRAYSHSPAAREQALRRCPAQAQQERVRAPP